MIATQLRSHMQVRINLKDAVDDLAPAPPPCFLNKVHWIEYLHSAAASQNNRGEQKIILVTEAGPLINVAYDFCEDCTDDTMQRMHKADRCKPDWMRS